MKTHVYASKCLHSYTVADKGYHNDMLHDELAGLINMLKDANLN